MVRVTRASAHASKEASVELAMFLAIHAILAPMAPLTSTGHVPDDCASLAVSADTQLISKAHIFSTARGFRAEPRNLGFGAELFRGVYRGIRHFRGMPRNLTFFCQTTFFSQKMTSK